MPTNNRGLRQTDSMPQWTAISNRSESPSGTPSQDEILESSQEMRDELMSPSPALPQKRKPSAERATYKRPRIAADEEQTTHSDLPASAHALPGRRASGAQNKPHQQRRGSDALISAFRQYNSRMEGESESPSRARQGSGSAATRDVPPKTYVAKKSTGKKPPSKRIQSSSTSNTRGAASTSTNPSVGAKEKGLTPLSASSSASHPALTTPTGSKVTSHKGQGREEKASSTSNLPEQTGRAQLKDKERRKTFPSATKTGTDIDLTANDRNPQLPKPNPTNRVSIALKARSRYAAQGKADDPIVLTDSDNDAPPPPAKKVAKEPEVIELVDSDSEQPGHSALREIPAHENPQPLDDGPAAISPATEDRVVDDRSKRPNVGSIVPALDSMAISPVSKPARNNHPRSPISSLVPPSSTGDAGMFQTWDDRDGSKSGTVSRSSASKAQECSGTDPDAMDVDPPALLPIPPEASLAGGRSPFQTPPRSPLTNYQKGSRLGTLFSGDKGFFKSVHDHRSEKEHSTVLSPTQRKSLSQLRPLAKAQPPAVVSASPVLPSRTLTTTPGSSGHSSKPPSPDAGASSGHELPPSSAEVSLRGSDEPQSRPRADSIPEALPVARQTTTDDSEPTASASTFRHRSTGSRTLKQTLDDAIFKAVEARGEVIDLTLSDDEDKADFSVIDGDPELTIASTIKVIGQTAPMLFNETASASVPSLAAPVPVHAIGPILSRPVPSLDGIRALKKRQPTVTGSSPPSRSVSGDNVAVAGPFSSTATHAPGNSSDEDVPLARISRRASAMSLGSDSDGVTMGEGSDEATKPMQRRGRSGKSRVIVSPAPEDDSDADALEAAQLLVDKDDDSEFVVMKLPPHQLRNLDGHVQPAARSARSELRRNKDTEDVIVPAMDNVHIDDEDSDLDDPHGTTITWEKNGRRLALEYANVNLRARDLPFNLQNRMMALPLEARMADGLQLKVFQSMINVGTVDDEPFAPEIHIINDVDNELTPAFEFHYTNRMYHGENVPGPDVYGLKGCDCIGACDPRSKTCPCVRKQMEAMETAVMEKLDRGFAYGPDGRVRTEHMEYPIFECNAACRCDDEFCQNRVVQKGRKVKINIKKTPNKGWGVFAGQAIPKNTFVGVYAGEYLTDAEGHQRGMMYDEFGRTYLFDVDFWYLRQPPLWDGDPDDWQVKFCVDAFHVGNFTRFLNHSCDPNCQIVPVYINEANMDKPLLTIWTQKSVAAGEELCFSYLGDPADHPPLTRKERSYLQSIHALCQCGSKKCKGRMWLIAPGSESSSRGSSEE